MENIENMEMPKYVKIAIDIAHRIYSGEFKLEDKLRGRSILSSKYNVSPETIRRSVSLLRDMNVVEVSEKSGIYIKSIENAYLFIQKFNVKNNINQIRERIKELEKEKQKIDIEISKNLDMILEYYVEIDRTNLKNSNEVRVNKNSHIINKTIADTQFWKHTNATIISIKRNDEVFISPGPYFIFNEGDTIDFICSEDNIEKTKRYIVGDYDLLEN